MEIKSETSTVLDLPPSAVAFCPSHPEYYVVGTYFLHPKEAGKNGDNDDGEEPSGEITQKRTGTLVLYRLEGSVFSHTQTVPLNSAVLDLEWTPHATILGTNLLCVATSTGSLEFYSFDSATTTATASLQWHSSKQISDASTLVLDLLWHPSRADVIAVTLSDGAVALCQSSGADGSGLWSEGRTCTVTTTECASHSLEPWTLAFGPPGAAGLLFSGGDDAVLQALRLSSAIDGIPSGCSKDDDNNDEDNEDDEQTLATQLWTDRKVHQAGVTSILPLASELLVTGSYDDRIRLLYAPALGRRRVLAELDLGGGVWRLKMLGGDKGNPPKNPSQDQQEQEHQPQPSSYTILASCMHAGTRIVQLTSRSSGSSASASASSSIESESEWEFTVLARFEEHKSMNYGSDVQPLRIGGVGVEEGGGEQRQQQQNQQGGKRVVVSTSFYDRLMCVWEF